jgi:glutaredoxin
MNEPEVVVYTRPGCCLCEEATELLRGQGLSPVLRDVDADPVARETFGPCVPVVLIDGKTRFRGRVDPRLLRRLLLARRLTGWLRK